MSLSTRSSGTSAGAAARAFALAVALTTAPAFAMADRAPPLPASVVALAPDLKAQGGGELTFFGLSVYDGWYWSPARGWPHSGPYALDLHYHRSLDGAKIALTIEGRLALADTATGTDTIDLGPAGRTVEFTRQ